MLKSISVLLLLSVLLSPALAQFDRTAMLLDSPTADVLPRNALMVSASTTGPLGENDLTDFWEANFNIRYGVYDRLEIALTAFTFEDWVLGASYQVKEGAWNRWSLSVGVSDLGYNEHISPLGHGEEYGETAWHDDDYRDDNGELIKPPENVSLFVISTFPLAQFADDLPPLLERTRFHFGIGRGRYVGYDGPNENLNSDVFFDEYHPESAIGVFGGFELNFGSFSGFPVKNLTFAAEYDSRDSNVGIKGDIGKFSAAIVLHKLESMTEDADPPFHRIGLALGYRTDFGEKEEEPAVAAWTPAPVEPPVVEPEPAPEPEPVPEPEPTPIPIAPPVPMGIVLSTIYFDYDMSSIRADQRQRLADNASVLETNPDMGVTVQGHCDERGTNEYNIALGQRRADSVVRYLINYGIDPARLTTVSYGEEQPVDFGHDESAWWKNRRAEFVIRR